MGPNENEKAMFEVNFKLAQALGGRPSMSSEEVANLLTPEEQELLLDAKRERVNGNIDASYLRELEKREGFSFDALKTGRFSKLDIEQLEVFLGGEGDGTTTMNEAAREDKRQHITSLAYTQSDKASIDAAGKEHGLDSRSLAIKEDPSVMTDNERAKAFGIDGSITRRGRMNGVADGFVDGDEATFALSNLEEARKGNNKKALDAVAKWDTNGDKIITREELEVVRTQTGMGEQDQYRFLKAIEKLEKEEKARGGKDELVYLKHPEHEMSKTDPNFKKAQQIAIDTGLDSNKDGSISTNEAIAHADLIVKASRGKEPLTENDRERLQKMEVDNGLKNGGWTGGEKNGTLTAGDIQQVMGMNKGLVGGQVGESYLRAAIKQMPESGIQVGTPDAGKVQVAPVEQDKAKTVRGEAQPKPADRNNPDVRPSAPAPQAPRVEGNNPQQSPNSPSDLSAGARGYRARLATPALKADQQRAIDMGVDRDGRGGVSGEEATTVAGIIAAMPIDGTASGTAEKWDTNKDGKVSIEELRTVRDKTGMAERSDGWNKVNSAMLNVIRKLASTTGLIDRNGDGKVDASEVKDFKTEVMDDMAKAGTGDADAQKRLAKRDITGDGKFDAADIAKMAEASKNLLTKEGMDQLQQVMKSLNGQSFGGVEASLPNGSGFQAGSRPVQEAGRTSP